MNQGHPGGVFRGGDVWEQELLIENLEVEYLPYYDVVDYRDDIHKKTERIIGAGSIQQMLPITFITI